VSAAWHPDITALILAGGKATRFGGIAKHAIVVDGQTIFARQVALLRPRVTELIVSAPTDMPPYRTVRDRIAGVGPLAGIAAGLSECRTSWLLVVAGDMPHLTEDLVDRMLDHVEDILERVGDTDAVGVRSGGLPEPLLCVLHRRVLPVVDARIAAGRYKASGLLTDESLRVSWIEAPDPRALRNVNSPEDL
jgi:molybdenum cofactor guanylyltransferase